MLYNLILSPETNCSHIRWLKMLKTKMFFSTASEAKREVKSLISIKTLMNSENMGHLWHKMSRIYLKKLRAPCQISSYFWVFWGKIQLSNGHKVSWFWVGWKILLDLIFPHVGLSSMPFWSKYTNPPTSMICGINFFKMLSTREKPKRNRENLVVPSREQERMVKKSWNHHIKSASQVFTSSF